MDRAVGCRFAAGAKVVAAFVALVALLASGGAFWLVHVAAPVEF